MIEIISMKTSLLVCGTQSVRQRSSRVRDCGRGGRVGLDQFQNRAWCKHLDVC